MRGVVALVLLLMATSGCATPGQPPDDPGGEIPSERMSRGKDTDTAATASDCVGLSAFVVLPLSTVQEQLPEGYTAGEYAPGVSAVHVVAVDCEAVTIEGISRTGVRLAWSQAWMEGANGYRWDFFVDEGEPSHLCALLETARWPCEAATIDIQDQRFVVTASNVTVRAEVPVVGRTDQVNFGSTMTIQTLGLEGQGLAFVETFDSGASITAFSGASVTADSGPLWAMPARPGDPLVGLGNALNSDWAMTTIV